MIPMDKHIDPDIYDEEYYLTSCSGYQEFSQSPGKKSDKRLKKVMDLASIKPNMKILDIGCGRGETVSYSAIKGAHAVGIDYSKAAIKIGYNALKLFDDEIRNRTSVLVCNAKKLPFKNNSFDRVFFLDIIEHLYPEEVTKTFGEIKRVLKPNGALIIHTAPNLWVHKYTYPLIRFILVNFFRKKMPRKLDWYSDYTTTMHINKQSTFSLKKTLDEFGFKSTVWLEDPNPDCAVLNMNEEEKNIIKRKLVWFLRSFFPFKLLFCNHIFAVAKKVGKEKEIKAFFDKSSSIRNVLYRKDPALSYEQDMRQKAVFELLEPTSNDVILDLGCGNARDILKSAKKCKYVYGIDMSRGMIKEGKKDIEHQNLNNVFLIVGSATGLPFADGSFDKISCSEVIEHIPEWENAIEEMTRCLKSNGRLVITTPNKKSVYRITKTIRDLIMKLQRKSIHPYDKWKTQDELIKILLDNNIKIEKKIGVCFLPGHLAYVLPNILKRFVTKIIYKIEKRIRYKATANGYNLAISGLKYSK